MLSRAKNESLVFLTSLYTIIHNDVVVTCQSLPSEWDSSESESVPVVRGLSSGAVGPAASTVVTGKPPLAAVTERSEVHYCLCLQLTVDFCYDRYEPVFVFCVR